MASLLPFDEKLALDHHHHAHAAASEENLEDHFELMHAVGMGFFGIVFFAFEKPFPLVEKCEVNKHDLREAFGKVKAVKICNPLCPSGTKASAQYLRREIDAVRRIQSRMKDHVRHNFAACYEYNTLSSPWY